MENQIQPPETNKASNRNWIALAIGGGCALIACIAVVAAVVLAVYGPTLGKTFSSISTNPISNPTSVPQIQLPNVVIPPARNPPQANGNKMGNPNAPVKIIEYGDFQCSFCRQYWMLTEPQIIQNYVATGKVYYEYRSVGGYIGPESADAANAAYCAADQNKFWEYHDMLFANYTGENAGNFTPDKLRQYAAAVNLNLDQFNTCINAGSHNDQVSQDFNDVSATGFPGAPFFILTYSVNGQTRTSTVDGAQPYSVFQQTIGVALQGQ
jgi:protein-disulfide isomerase